MPPNRPAATSNRKAPWPIRDSSPCRPVHRRRDRRRIGAEMRGAGATASADVAPLDMRRSPGSLLSSTIANISRLRKKPGPARCIVKDQVEAAPAATARAGHARNPIARYAWRRRRSIRSRRRARHRRQRRSSIRPRRSATDALSTPCRDRSRGWSSARRCSIGANAVVGAGVVLGDDVRVGANATLSHCVIGIARSASIPAPVSARTASASP